MYEKQPGNFYKFQDTCSCTRKTHEYWIMCVAFEHSSVTVCNMQECSCCQQDSLWMAAVLLVTFDTLLAVGSLSLPDVGLPD